jgi:feruloyl esterase
MIFSHQLRALQLAAGLLGVLANGFALSTCTSLTKSSCLSQYNASIVNATSFGVGEKNVSGTQNDIAFCEVNAVVRYSNNDSLSFAVWLPNLDDASRFMAIGNGGQAGVIVYEDMMAELNSGLGFAVTGGDGGHLFADNDVGAGGNLGKPGAYQPYLHDDDQIKAWLHNAIALFTPAAQRIFQQVYGQHPTHSYYRGCSAGGAQGFALAEFYPELFNGIIAGGSCNFFSHQILAFLWNQQQYRVSRPMDLIAGSILLTRRL